MTHEQIKLNQLIAEFSQIIYDPIKVNKCVTKHIDQILSLPNIQYTAAYDGGPSIEEFYNNIKKINNI